MKKADRAREKVAWGITGCGDKLRETFEIMRGLKGEYADRLQIEVFLSTAGEQVAKYYRLFDDLKQHFERVWVEKNSNSPFLAGRLQLGEFEFLLVAPASSNTVAKLSIGISDTMLTNGAIQSLKASVPVYVMPVDYREGTTVTKLPNGRDLKLRVRKEDAENVSKLTAMEGIFPFEKPEEIRDVFLKHFGSDGAA
ncbi:MAG: archaeoflavoprotein AfpA [Candidatus Bathyarchaeota archaeon]|jgi:archaeoflavoprotein AfpA|nr:archaeoflavoprotein AfpA [Candidatus Bathyarchaeota archaeon]